MIERLITKRAHDLGGGFTVGRVLPFHARRMVGPYIFFDHIGPVDLPPGIHEIEARCWIVAAGPYESSLDPLVLEFDAEGHPIFPEEVVVYDLPIRASVNAR